MRNELSESEIGLIRSNLQKDRPLGVDVLLRVLNGKRPPESRLTDAELFQIIDEIQSESSPIVQGSEIPLVQAQSYSETEKERIREKNEASRRSLEEKRNQEELASKLFAQFQPLLDVFKRSQQVDAYKIVHDKTVGLVEAEVRSLMREGWTPLGGISAAAFGISPVGGNAYIQAMVKYRK